MPDAIEFAYATTCPADDCRTLLPHPAVVLDCGAYTGEAARGLRLIYPDARIYCFEPASAVFGELYRVCQEIGAVPIKRAVGAYSGRAVLNVTQFSACSSLLGYQPGNPYPDLTSVVRQERVDICTLDQWCAEAGIRPHEVGVIKLDVQGAELQAIEGARGILATPTLVYVEVCFAQFYASAPLFGDIEAAMAEAGYCRYAVYQTGVDGRWADALYITM